MHWLHVCILSPCQRVLRVTAAPYRHPPGSFNWLLRVLPLPGSSSPNSSPIGLLGTLPDKPAPLHVDIQAAGLQEQVKELQKRVAKLKAGAVPSQAELTQLAALEKQLKAEEAEADKCRQSFAPSRAR